MKDGLVLVGNTAGRREELVEALTAILTAGRLGKQEALRLRGRLQFASGQVFGQVARAALAAVTSHAYGDGASKLSIRTVLALTLHRQPLLSGRPRELRPTVDDTWYIQTDACFEPGEETVFSGIGAVLFNPRGERVRFFSQRLDTEILKKLNAQGAIYECEFFALFVRFAMFYFSR